MKYYRIELNRGSGFGTTLDKPNHWADDGSFVENFIKKSDEAHRLLAKKAPDLYQFDFGVERQSCVYIANSQICEALEKHDPHCIRAIDIWYNEQVIPGIKCFIPLYLHDNVDYENSRWLPSHYDAKVIGNIRDLVAEDTSAARHLGIFRLISYPVHIIVTETFKDIMISGGLTCDDFKELKVSS